MMQSTASPFPCKEEPQIKEEIIDVKSTSTSSVDVDGGEVVTGNTLHNQRIASISTNHAASPFRARAVFSRHNLANTLPFTPFTPYTPVTPVTPAAHFTPVTPAVPVTPTTVPNNTFYGLYTCHTRYSYCSCHTRYSYCSCHTRYSRCSFHTRHSCCSCYTYHCPK